MYNTASVTSLNFAAQQGAKFSHVFPTDFTPEDLYKAVAAKMFPNFVPPTNEPGCINANGFPFQLISKGKTVPENSTTPGNKAKFEEIKATMSTVVPILVVRRMNGGSNDSGMLDFDIHVRNFFAELDVELNKIVEQPNSMCSICRKNKNCMKIPCPQIDRCLNTVCKTCFQYYYATENYAVRCQICRQFSDLVSFLTNADFKKFPFGGAKMMLSNDFKASHAQFKESLELTRYIDFQICKCGTYFINTTMYSRQNCPKCQRWMCFFCNENWDENTMQNQQYTCGLPSCTYQQLLDFELIESDAYKGLWVPSTRCCPKCGHHGAFDKKCKFHECPNCHHDFCYLCLKEKSNRTCPKEPGCDATSYQSKCVDPPVQQTYTVFPRIGS